MLPFFHRPLSGKSDGLGDKFNNHGGWHKTAFLREQHILGRILLRNTIFEMLWRNDPMPLNSNPMLPMLSGLRNSQCTLPKATLI